MQEGDKIGGINYLIIYPYSVHTFFFLGKKHKYKIKKKAAAQEQQY